MQPTYLPTCIINICSVLYRLVYRNKILMDLPKSLVYTVYNSLC